MNICMFSPFSLSMESSTHRLISFGEELVKRGNQVSIVLPSYDRHTEFKIRKVNSINGIRLFQPYQPKIRSIELTTLPYIITSFLKVVPQNYDVIHVLKPLPANFSAYIFKFIKNTPLVQDMDDLDHNVMVIEKHSSTRTMIVKLGERILPRVSNHVITVSSTLRQIYFKMGLEENNITWIPNGVKTSDFNNYCESSLKEVLGLKEKVIVYLGSLNNKLQVYPLIKAMELVTKERKDVSCLVIGNGSEKDFLIRAAKELILKNNMKFLNKIPYEDINKYLAICDIGFACMPPPLLSTGGALKIFMYMASGLPVIVNNVGDLPYYIDFGKAGVISSLNPELLSSAILELLNNDKIRHKKGLHAKTYVRENFDWAVLTNKLLKIYHEII